MCFQKHLIIKIVQQPNGLTFWASRKCYIQVEEVQAAQWWFCNVYYEIWQGLAVWVIVGESISSCRWILSMTNNLSDIFPICFPDPDLKVLSGQQGTFASRLPMRIHWQMYIWKPSLHLEIHYCLWENTCSTPPPPTLDVDTNDKLSSRCPSLPHIYDGLAISSSSSWRPCLVRQDAEPEPKRALSTLCKLVSKYSLLNLFRKASDSPNAGHSTPESPYLHSSSISTSSKAGSFASRWQLHLFEAPIWHKPARYFLESRRINSPLICY